MNYEHISRAVEFYKDRGYVYLDDAPWYVGKAAYYATKPGGATDLSIMAENSTLLNHMGFMVASGEQSFIQMMIDGQPIKRAICVTPCFRAEPRFDTLHRPYFMKAELINAQDVDEGHLVHMVHDACTFFEQFFPVRVVKTQRSDLGTPSYDIVEKGSRFELGSYGIRNQYISGLNEPLKWIYGTACAEPRLSTAIQKALKHTGK